MSYVCVSSFFFCLSREFIYASSQKYGRADVVKCQEPCYFRYRSTSLSPAPPLMLHHRQPTHHHLIQERLRQIPTANLQFPFLPHTKFTVVELCNPLIALIHQHQIVAEHAVAFPLQRADGAAELVRAREQAAGVHGDGAAVHGEVDGAAAGVEVGGADGRGGFGGGAAAENAHVRFGAEDGAGVGGDGVEGGEFVGVADGEVAVGEAVEVDVEKAGLREGRGRVLSVRLRWCLLDGSLLRVFLEELGGERG